jgi:hypothetical protein
MNEPGKVRRIIVIDEADRGVAILDAPSPDVRTDPARPGFASTRIWVNDTTPKVLSGLRETLDAPHTLEPPRNGSVLRVYTFPPESTYIHDVGEDQVRAYFESIGSPDASTFSASTPHPYMQQTDTLDLCFVTEGEITLVLDTEEVNLEAGTIVVQRATNHAWSNRSDKPCVVVISSHDARRPA